MNNEMISFFLSVLILLSPFLLKRKHDVSSLSGMTTTLGILGTFVGIFIGLIGFDVNNIQASVPLLLEGLKTAFLTSIAGMVAGLILKVAPILYGIRIERGDAEKEEATLEAVVRHLATIEKDQKRLSEENGKQLVKIEKALCGEGETTLLTQIQKLRTSFADKQDELVQAFKSFAEKVAENNSKALIEALTEVMKDFNVKINEQFGDNFKRLNEAVGKILEWQQEYGRQVEQMVRQIETASKAVERSEQTLSQMVVQAGEFSRVSKDLSTLLTALEQVRKEIADHLKAFDQLATNAKSAFPVIDEQLRKMTTELTKSVDRTVTESKNLIALQVESSKQVGISLQEGQKNLSTSLNEVVATLNRNIDKMMKDNTERITQQITQLDKELGNELIKSLQTLGSQLASLSRRFVEDYTPLTEKLRELVRVAGNQGR